MTTGAYSSEVFPENLRLSSWESELGMLGIGTDLTAASELFYASVARKTSPKGVAFHRLVFTAQTLSFDGLSHSSTIIMSNLQSNCELSYDDAKERVSQEDLLFASKGERFQISFEADARLLITVVPKSLLDVCQPQLGPAAPRILKGNSSASVTILNRLLLSVADTFEILRTDELAPIDAALQELLSLEHFTEASQEVQRKTHANLLTRLTLRIDSRLEEPHLSASEIALAEGVSLRYLHRVFESSGINFSKYLRKRRLEKISKDLANPRSRHQSVSEISFRWGFNDAAHFSRSFRQEFGVTPREFRRLAIQDVEVIAKEENRGWPMRALQDTTKLARDQRDGAMLNALPETRPNVSAKGERHILKASPETVHWGYFSRQLPPVLEVSSGDTITIETLTQHAYDDFDRMIRGDLNAEDGPCRKFFRLTRC